MHICSPAEHLINFTQSIHPLCTVHEATELVDRFSGSLFSGEFYEKYTDNFIFNLHWTV
jgi:hypothetical protein